MTGALLDGLQQAVAAPLGAIIRVYRQAGEFRDAAGIGVECGAGHDHAVALYHQKMVDLHFQQFARAFHQYPFLLQGRNQLQNTADVIDAGGTQALIALSSDQSTDAVAREQLHQQAAVGSAVDQVGALHAAPAALHGIAQVADPRIAECAA